jgi:hypothetical protein
VNRASSVAIFSERRAIIGCKWSLKHRLACAVVFIIGMSLHVFSIGALFFFNDDDALGAESQALLGGGEEEVWRVTCSAEAGVFAGRKVAGVSGSVGQHKCVGAPFFVVRGMEKDALHPGCSAAMRNSTPARVVSVADDWRIWQDEDAEVERRLAAAEGSRNPCFSWLHVGMIPWIVACSDCCFGLASGMTIKVFIIYTY